MMVRVVEDRNHVSVSVVENSRGPQATGVFRACLPRRFERCALRETAARQLTGSRNSGHAHRYMTARTLLPCVVAALLLGGCRMADGPLPVEDREVPNRLEDLNRNLGNIAAGHPEAVQDLYDDLRVFVDFEEKPSAAPAIEELSRQVGSALPKAPLAQDRGLQLSRQLWLTVASRELSEKQVEKLQSDVQVALVGVGISDQRARAIAAQAGEVQKQVADRSRRWYELF